MGPQPTLNKEQESRFLDHVKYMATLGYVYTRQEIIDMATEYCIHLNLKAANDKPLSVKWLRGYTVRVLILAGFIF